jgi:hypothetical protein
MKKKPFITISLLVIALIGFGFYGLHVSQVNRVKADFDQLAAASYSNAKWFRQAIINNATCFTDESLTRLGQSAKCVTNLQAIRNRFFESDKQNMSNLATYYATNASRLDPITKAQVDATLRLYGATVYTALMSAWDEYLQAYIEWHAYFRDYVQVKGFDNMTTHEIMKVKPLAQAVLDSESHLKETKNGFNDFLQANFDQSFIDSQHAIVESMKQ